MGESTICLGVTPISIIRLVMKQTTNPFPPTEVILEGLYSRFIDLLRDYNFATADWRLMLKEDLKEIYEETLSYSGVKNIGTNPYYKLISHRSLDEHLILSKPRPRIL